MNPIIPGTAKDRTGAGRIIRHALSEIDRRFKGLQTDVLAIFARIPVYALNAELSKVLYGLTPPEMATLSAELQAAVARWIADGRDPANMLWWSPYEEQAVQLGTAQAVANLSNLSPAYAATRSIEAIVYSPPYVNRLAMAQIKNQDHWVGLAAQQKSELSQIIGRAVVDGKNPRAVQTEIMERLEVSKSKAAQWAQTDITDTLRQARWAEAGYTAETMGLKIGILWTSALKPTTRPWHASRNGRVYSTDEVKAFYASGKEKYNCLCGNTEALLDADGKAILTDRLKASMLAERTAWQASNP